MCFSPEASFAGGVIISAIGVVTIKKVHKPSQIVFAGIPLFFGIQQIVEGFLWVTLQLPDLISIQRISTYLFLIMALVIWPFMIPLSVTLMEEDGGRKKNLRHLLVLGVILSAYYSFCLIFFKVNPNVSCYHILYKNDFPSTLSMPAFMIYLFVTITPLFISGIKRTWMLGVLMMLSCLVTAIFFTQFLTSVWCFFAALISGVVYWILMDSKRNFSLNKIKLLNTGQIK
jgi:hypothetical protein